ncbi:MAG: hypothetical protein ACT4PE_06000 [Candidatus Eiseniibacteriota bacterium]
MLRPIPAVLAAVPLLALLASQATGQPAAVTGAAARQAFDRIKTLDGTWIGTSTNGWTERIQYRVIAKESCVMETSFDAHPNEMMVTMFCPDGERLLLTHYCVATNQPRLVLTFADAEVTELTFEFLDGTNLSTRDRGHMDKVVFRFLGTDEFTTRWTWYQDGKESWMEEIRCTRAPDAPPSSSEGGAPASMGP